MPLPTQLLDGLFPVTRRRPREPLAYCDEFLAGNTGNAMSDVIDAIVDA